MLTGKFSYHPVSYPHPFSYHACDDAYDVYDDACDVSYAPLVSPLYLLVFLLAKWYITLQNHQPWHIF